MKYTSRGRCQSVARVIQMERLAFDSSPIWIEKGDKERQNYLKYKERRNGVIRIKKNSILSQRLHNFKKEKGFIK